MSILLSSEVTEPVSSAKKQSFLHEIKPYFRIRESYKGCFIDYFVL